MSVGDVNSTERGSGARYNDGKPDLSLIPLETLFDEARVWMHGEKKYARFNWQKGMDWSIPLACALRHLSAWQAGEELDSESGLPHIAHAMCNLRMLTYYAEHYPEGDNRSGNKPPVSEKAGTARELRDTLIRLRVREMTDDTPEHKAERE